MDENPSGDQPTLTKDGEEIPSIDLIVGGLIFGLTEDSIRTKAQEREEDAVVLREDGIEKILIELKNLYDTIKVFEKAGLRGEVLELKVNQDERLLAASKRYYSFARERIWGYRLQSVWIAGW